MVDIFFDPDFFSILINGLGFYIEFIIPDYSIAVEFA